MSKPFHRSTAFGLAAGCLLVLLACATSTRAQTALGGGGERAESRPQQVSKALGVRGSATAVEAGSKEPLEVTLGDPRMARVHYWLNSIPPDRKARSLRSGGASNIRQSDYAGAESCKECHAANYEKWTGHAHRLMNALATPETVRGDFSGTHVMRYLGGEARFFQEGGTNFMRLEREKNIRLYSIGRTIGSRFFQYYVGRLVQGPEPADHLARLVDHVLPLGYLIHKREWMPIVHIDEEKPDGQRFDAFAGPSDIPYDQSCSACHTTWPVGDWLTTLGGLTRAQYFSPFPFNFLASAYLEETHPDILRDLRDVGMPNGELLGAAFSKIQSLPVKDHAVALGISCEACHNGSKEHVANSTNTFPFFFPVSPHLASQGPMRSAVWTRRPQNLNWTCARCHSGGRPSYANGIAAWNSVEFADGTSGFCYLKDPMEKRALPGLTCVHCHNPHQGIGQKWSKTPEQDDGSCVECHKQYTNPATRLAHTHHPAGTDGDRCMNCHMPKINEGLQDVVRTHRIFNPTDPKMIEANQPNACNLCHLKENIDWTIGHLKQWYPRTAGPYAEEKLAANYPNRLGPVGTGWLKGSHEHTRLVAAEAAVKADARWALPEVLEILDDAFLINRRFTQHRLEESFGVDLRQSGYHFYQLKEERAEPLKTIKAELLRKAAK